MIEPFSGQVNGDGRLDLFVGNEGSANELWLHTGATSSSSPFFTGASSAGPTSATLASTKTLCVLLGDTNGDGCATALSESLLACLPALVLARACVRA